MDSDPRTPSRTGIIVATSRGEHLYSNREALSILAYPNPPESVQTGKSAKGSRLSTVLTRLLGGTEASSVELRSGKRQYSCQAYSLDGASPARARKVVLVTLERQSRQPVDGSHLVDRFGLTKREAETALLLVEGLTNKEIATRMQVAPNTVKAFLKLVMLKMHTKTRAGVVGKIMGS